MSESELSHRGLMKVANAKMDYVIELDKIERFIRKNGETPEINYYMDKVDREFIKKIHRIYNEDKLLNMKG